MYAVSSMELFKVLQSFTVHQVKTSDNHVPNSQPIHCFYIQSNKLPFIHFIFDEAERNILFHFYRVDSLNALLLTLLRMIEAYLESEL